MNNTIQYLGMDISTSMTGVSILEQEDNNQEPKLIYANYIDTSKEDNLIDKAIVIKDFLYNLKEQYTISKIFIEDKLSNFAQGQTNALSMNKLIAFNGITSFIIYIIFKIYPIAIHPSSARKTAWGTIPQTIKDKKFYCMEKVLKKWPEFKSYIQYSKDRRTGQLKIKDKPTYDISDSITVCYAGVKNV